MRTVKIFLLLLLSGTGFTQSENSSARLSSDHGIQNSAIPSLDELSADWMQVSSLRNYPTVMNFIGGVQSSANLTAFQNLTIAPYAQGGLSCELLLDGKSLGAKESRWYPYEVRRKTTVNEVELESAMRMPFEQQGVLIRLKINNHSKMPGILKLSMNIQEHLRQYAPQQWRKWDNDRPIDSNFIIQVDRDQKSLVISDHASAAVEAFSFSNRPEELKATAYDTHVQWVVKLAPGKSRVIEIAYAIGGDASLVNSTAKNWATNFDNAFNVAKIKWEERWQNSFKPGNRHFSGHFPTLVTDDDKIRRVYYQGTLIPLLLCRTNLPYSKRSFVTAGPQWANTLVYFWDAEMWANTWAMLEPEAMKEQMKKWFLLDFHNCYAVECLTGEGAGPWYAANDWAIFRCVEAYLGVTGDMSFLKQNSNGKSILQHLDAIATFYESRPLNKSTLLADYGGAGNLLECSPSYIQGVPSLNAANVYMLRKAAEYQDKYGNPERAKELSIKADKLLPYVMALYESGQGVWNAQDDQGNKVPVRHCYDYITIGQALEKELTSQMKTEMNHFVQSELLTKTWMRAMSQRDPAAAKSDRPDHGPMGSYDGWPPMTMTVMCNFGSFDKSIAFLRSTEAITRQGSWAQSHEFVGPDSLGYDPIVRVANRGGQDANEGCGAAFADVLISSFFGYRPDLSENKLVLLLPDTPRGFNGKLKHITWHGRLYTIESDSTGVHAKEEKK